MKYLIILGDGMADMPLCERDNLTPLAIAKKPHIDALVPHSELGLVKTVPDNMKPGSDTANLSVMGYDPNKYYSGRSPLEAVSIGIEFSERDVTYRANLVTLSSEQQYSKKTMVDYSSGEITTEEATELINYVKKHINTKDIELYAGVSYRHCLLMREAETGAELTPPHDISGKCITDYLPSGTNSNFLLEIMQQSYELLSNHPINLARVAKGLHPANSLWFWGEGRKPQMPLFYDKFGIKGAVISAVDLIKGIGYVTGLKVYNVEGATGTLHTNYKGKVDAVLKAFDDGSDFVYLHLEGPDECGHQGDIDGKIKAIEYIDEKVVAPIVDSLNSRNIEYSLLLLPDHPTPLATRTHSRDPVPYMLYRSDNSLHSAFTTYTEDTAQKSGNFVAEGYTLLNKLIK